MEMTPSAEKRAIEELASFAADGFFEVQVDAQARNIRHVKRLTAAFEKAFHDGKASRDAEIKNRLRDNTRKYLDAVTPLLKEQPVSETDLKTGYDIARASIDMRVCCEKQPPCQVEQWCRLLAANIAAALRDAHAEIERLVKLVNHLRDQIVSNINNSATRLRATPSETDLEMAREIWIVVTQALAAQRQDLQTIVDALIAAREQECARIITLGRKMASEKRSLQYNISGNYHRDAATLEWFLDKIERGEHNER